VSFGPTPAQTVGPFFSIGLPWSAGPDAVHADTPGALTISGRVYDGAGELVSDNLIETWQADPHGRFADGFGYGGPPSELPGFRGFARSGAEEGDGGWAIRTVKPGAVGMQAPHIDVSVFARGLLHRCVTRIYFADEAELNARDAVLQSVAAQRRDTLLAQPVDGGYRFDIHLQGPRETVFFAL
jgi:protocatechuate 3,4-dioxygenase alpha subunit